jgi:electron transfer flavoprotein alpha subunit
MMAQEKTKVFVIVEHGQRAIERVSLQLVGKARQLADELDCGVGAILLGSDLAGSEQELIEAGADLVLQGDAETLELYQAELYTEIIVKLLAEYHPEILLAGSTAMGRELAPLLAARLETGLTAHCIDLAINNSGILEQRIPAYGGMITIICPVKRPQVATVAEGVFPNPVLDSSRTGEVIPIEIPESIPLRARTLEIVQEELTGISLDYAPVIVAGGAGVGDVDGWREITELASVLNAGLGSTRPVVDAGWSDFDSMIGQSGKMVNPDLYIGVGIAGSKIMVAVNNDPKSRIFKQVDYGVVEDCRIFVPAVVKALKDQKAKHV